MENRTKDEVIYVRADRRLKDRFEKQKDESGYRGNADFISYLLDVNEGKRVDGVTLKEIRELLKEAVHELKKQGVNLNQIAHVQLLWRTVQGAWSDTFLQGYLLCEG